MGVLTLMELSLEGRRERVCAQCRWQHLILCGVREVEARSGNEGFHDYYTQPYTLRQLTH